MVETGKANDEVTQTQTQEHARLKEKEDVQVHLHIQLDQIPSPPHEPHWHMLTNKDKTFKSRLALSLSLCANLAIRVHQT